MTNERESKSADRNNDRRKSAGARLDRRTVLKGTAAGLAGVTATGTASAAEKVIVFQSVGEETFRYEVTVTGSIEPGGPYETDAGDSIGDGTATGAAADGRSDSYVFTGEIADLSLDGPGKVFVDGELLEDTTALPNAITVEAGKESVAYAFKVSGQVERASEAESEDRIDGGRVRGSLGPGDIDTFRYSGSIAFEEATNPVTVTLDIDPDDS